MLAAFPLSGCQSSDRDTLSLELRQSSGLTPYSLPDTCSPAMPVTGMGLSFEETCSNRGRPTVSETGFTSRLSLAETREITASEVPGQPHGGQNDHHKHQEDVAFVYDDDILT